MKKQGIWVSPTEFVSFSEAHKSLSEQIATRSRSIDFHSLGMYLPNPDPVLKALGKDIQVYKELRSDAHVGGCIRRRKASVKALEWGVDKEKSKSAIAKSISAIFADLNISRIINEILDAALFGYQPLEVMWGKVGNFIVPVDIVSKPPNWFVYDAENQLRLRTKQNMVMGEELPPNKFLIARQDPSYDNPYGFADLSMCFWPTTFKKGGLKFWVQFTEKYGTPWVIGKHPRSASDGEKELLLDSLEAMVQDAVAVIPDDSSIEIKEAAGKAGSTDAFESLLHFCRSEVSIALLGQNQTTEATSNRASAQVGREVTHDIRDGDKAIVQETFNQLIRWICDLNFKTGAAPIFSMWEQEDVDKVLAERDQKLTLAGAKFTPAYFKRAYNLLDGDLDESATPVSTQTNAAADFAESDTAPDQQMLDDALDAFLKGDELQTQANNMLQPVIYAINGKAKSDALLAMLAELYVDMDASELQDRLARAIFVAKVWGRIHG